MICDEFKISAATGVIVNQLEFGAFELEKGHRLTNEDIARLKKNGVTKIFGFIMEENDLSFQTALGIVGAKLCGQNTAYSIGKDGICRIISTIPGIFLLNEERVEKFNRINRNIILNVVEPYSFVGEKEVIATVEITLPIIPEEDINDIVFRLSGNVSLLSVHNVSNKKAGLIYGRFSESKAETEHYTDVVRKLVKDFPLMNMDFVHEYETSLTTDDLANTIQRALKDDTDILFILAGRRNSCEQDIATKALNSIVDDIVSLSLPQAEVSDLLIAGKKNKRLIVIPYNYDKVDTSYLVRYIKQAITADKLNTFDFNHPQNYIIKELKTLDADFTTNMISSEVAGLDSKDSHVAAIVLAAGIGARAGRNKLLAEVNGHPLFLKALEAAVKSKASPVFLVTGYQAEQMEEYVEDIDVSVIYNSAYRSGIRTSIDLAMKSVPGFCDGAIIIPADMPNISAEHINKMIAAFDKNNHRQLVVSVSDNVKYNPVLWGRDLYDYADIVPENADLRSVFLEHADYTKTIAFKNRAEVFDITYPSDIEDLLKNRE